MGRDRQGPAQSDDEKNKSLRDELKDVTDDAEAENRQLAKDAHQQMKYHNAMNGVHEDRQAEAYDAKNMREHGQHRVAAQRHGTAADHFASASNAFQSGRTLKGEIHMERAERAADDADHHSDQLGMERDMERHRKESTKERE